MKKLFCFGMGYSSQWLGQYLLKESWEVSGTVRNTSKIASLNEMGFNVYPWSNGIQADEVMKGITEATHILISIPPDEEGDMVIRNFETDFAHSPFLEWVGYLSSTGVYGHHNGGWVDESSPLKPRLNKTKNRILAERNCMSLFIKYEIPIHIFRLAGIYGPNRNVLKSLQDGKAHRIKKKNHVFSRIHIEDIIITLLASIEKPHPGSIYNIADDEPAPHADVVAYGACLLGILPPPLIDFEKAKISNMAKAFYTESRQVKNSRIKADFGIKLKYPTYREGLKKIARDFVMEPQKRLHN